MSELSAREEAEAAKAPFAQDEVRELIANRSPSLIGEVAAERGAIGSLFVANGTPI